MCEFVIGNVCIEVPQGIGLRTSLDGSCVTLDFEDSGFNGKMKLRKVVEEAKELAPAATAPVEKVSGASAEIKAEKPSPTPPPPQLDSQTSKSSKISLSSDVKSDVKRPSSQEKKEIKPRRHQLVVASDGMDKPSGPSDTVSNETFETENMVTEEKQNKKPAAVVTTTTLDSAKNEKKQQKTKEQPAAGRKRKQLSLTEKKQNMRQRRMSDFGSKKPAMTTGAEHAYKKSSGVNWAKKEDLTALTPRCGATASFDPATEKVYVCGGLAEDGYLDDLWILDTKSWQWSQGGSSGLRKRAWHTSSIVNDKLLVFGGQCDLPKESRQDEEDDVKLLDELTMFDFETGVWFAAHTTGEAPCARSGHSATPIDNNRLVVFGGMNNEGMLMNDVHVLDTVLFSWSVPKTKGSPIKPRGYHTAVLIGHRIIFFGGIGKCNWAFKEIYSLDTQTWKWSEHSSHVQGEPPCSRVGQVVTVLPDGKSILVHGGHDPDEPSRCFDDSTILDTSKWSWVSMQTGYTRPSPRAGHCGVQVGNTFSTFCGQLPNGEKSKEMWHLDVSSNISK